MYGVNFNAVNNSAVNTFFNTPKILFTNPWFIITCIGVLVCIAIVCILLIKKRRGPL